MGMSDLQFKAYLRSLIARLEHAKKAQDWKMVEELQDEFQKALED